jgi:putative Ca2+/H+ antiporter (TMEM165/GDT1 family)
MSVGLFIRPAPEIHHGNLSHLDRSRRPGRDRRQDATPRHPACNPRRQAPADRFGYFAATISNHFLAALLGAQAAAFLDGQWFRTAIGLSFIAMAVWTLVPDRLDDDEGTTHTFARGAFMTTLVAFFLVEMGDKTQIATVALASRFGDALLVTLATTIGMMIAIVPAVFLGNALLRRIPLATVRLVAAGLFLLIGVAVLLQATGVGT